MRYRIQIEPMLGCTLVVVTELDQWKGRLTADSKLYTLDDDIGAHGSIVEILGTLQRMIGETAP
jgi:hypothetical protein